MGTLFDHRHDFPTRRVTWSAVVVLAGVALGLVACGRPGMGGAEPTRIPQPTPDRTMDAVIRAAASPMALGSPPPVVASPQAAPARQAARTPQPAARPKGGTPQAAPRSATPRPAAISPTNVAPRLPTPKPAVINPTTVAPPRSNGGR